MNGQQKKTILIVDDVRLFQLIMEQALTSEKYQLIFKKTGKAALDVIMRKKIDLLILDLHLPDMNGLEVLEGVKRIDQKLVGVCDSETIAQLKDFPVIIVTAFSTEEAKTEAERLGVDGFMSKPIRISQIRALVRKVLEENYRRRRRKKLVLCVDSEPRVQKFYQGALSDERYNIITTSNAMEALEVVELRDPDLIITELNLPEMSGTDFLQIVRETNKDIPVIIASTVSEQGAKERIKNLGIKKYLSKPLNLNKLREDVREIFQFNSQENTP